MPIALTNVIVDIIDQDQYEILRDRLQDGLERTPGVISVQGPKSSRDRSQATFVVEHDDCPERDDFIAFLLERFPEYRRYGHDRLAHRYVEYIARDIAEVSSEHCQSAPA